MNLIGERSFGPTVGNNDQSLSICGRFLTDVRLLSTPLSLGPVSRDNLTPTQGADTPAKGCSVQDERKVYEEQLGHSWRTL